MHNKLRPVFSIVILGILAAVSLMSGCATLDEARRRANAAINAATAPGGEEAPKNQVRLNVPDIIGERVALSIAKDGDILILTPTALDCKRGQPVLRYQEAELGLKEGATLRPYWGSVINGRSLTLICRQSGKKGVIETWKLDVFLTFPPVKGSENEGRPLLGGGAIGTIEEYLNGKMISRKNLQNTPTGGVWVDIGLPVKSTK